MHTKLQNRLANGSVLRQRYKIIKLISDRSSFGITYLAEDLDLPENHQCVVKHLKPNNPDSRVIEIANRLFEEESKHLHKLGEHDQIPRLYACFEEDKEFYLVQEYIKGKDLCSEIRNGKLWTEEDTIKYLKEILNVLDFIHRKKIIHRDIKPDNIIRRQRDRKLVLIDFGAVKEISNTEINIQGQQLTVAIGPNYMPEEQRRGMPVLASDIYSVGVIAIWGLTGSPNVLGWANCSKIEVSERLIEILNKMTDSDHQRRYQNACEALNAIDKTIINSITPPTIWEKFKAWW